jgi:hypothetical protein
LAGGINGQRTGDSELGPLFLPRWSTGTTLTAATNPPYDVLEIKDEEDNDGNKVNVLILIEWSIVAGVRQPHLTQLVDLGPHPYTDTKKITRMIRLQLHSSPPA